MSGAVRDQPPLEKAPDVTFVVAQARVQVAPDDSGSQVGEDLARPAGRFPLLRRSRSEEQRTRGDDRRQSDSKDR